MKDAELKTALIVTPVMVDRRFVDALFSLLRSSEAAYNLTMTSRHSRASKG